MMFRNRTDAGRKLGKALQAHGQNDSLVLGIPRGGAEVAFEVARELKVQFSLIVVASLCTVYVVTAGIEHVMPFVFMTAFPCTIPNTLVALVGIRGRRTSSQAAFWAVILGVAVSLFWGLVLDDPFGVPNIVIALVVPLLILGGDWLIGLGRPRRAAPAVVERTNR